MEDELESLREKSAFSTDVYEDMDYDEGSSGLAGFMNQLTPGQRLILAVLLLLDVIAIAIGLLLITGAISF